MIYSAFLPMMQGNLLINFLIHYIFYLYVYALLNSGRFISAGILFSKCVKF